MSQQLGALTVPLELARHSNAAALSVLLTAASDSALTQIVLSNCLKYTAGKGGSREKAGVSGSMNSWHIIHLGNGLGVHWRRHLKKEPGRLFVAVGT